MCGLREKAIQFLESSGVKLNLSKVLVEVEKCKENRYLIVLEGGLVVDVMLYNHATMASIYMLRGAIEVERLEKK